MADIMVDKADDAASGGEEGGDVVPALVNEYFHDNEYEERRVQEQFRNENREDFYPRFNMRRFRGMRRSRENNNHRIPLPRIRKAEKCHSKQSHNTHDACLRTMRQLIRKVADCEKKLDALTTRLERQA